LIVSEYTKNAINNPHYHWILLDQLIVKGKKEPVKIYTVFDTPVYTRTMRHLEQAWNFYVSGKFDKAAENYSKITFSPLEDYSTIMINRCYTLMAKPRLKWKGVWEATTK